MSENENKNKNIITRPALITGLGMIAVSLITGGLAYSRLPDKVPIHWNAAGQVDGWGSPFQGAFLMPLIMTGIFLLLLFLPYLDPKRRNYPAMSKAYSAIVLVLILLLTAIHLGTIGGALGYISLDKVPTFIMLGVGVLFVIMG